MITATLLTGFGLALAPQGADFPIDFPVELKETTRMSLQVEETHFAAQSFSETPLLIVLASEDRSLQTALWLPPGASYVEDFARGTLDGLQMEVLSPAAGAWTHSGSFFLGDFVLQGTGELWVQDCGHVLTRWNEGAPLTATTPAGSLLPPTLNALIGDAGAHTETLNAGDGATNSFHVPVPTPSDTPQEDKPPRKRRPQLPPV